MKLRADDWVKVTRDCSLAAGTVGRVSWVNENAVYAFIRVTYLGNGIGVYVEDLELASEREKAIAMAEEALGVSE